jgi:hypothetical protein
MKRSADTSPIQAFRALAREFLQPAAKVKISTSAYMNSV